MDEQLNYQSNPPRGNGFRDEFQLNLPNSSIVLILGILSIVFSCWYFSIVGVIMGIIALILANKDLKLYYSNTSGYTLASYNNVKAGRICAFIGLTVALIFLIFLILILIGIVATFPFWGMVD